MNEYTYEYAVIENHESEARRVYDREFLRFTSIFSEEHLTWLAEAAAENFWNQHDGWEIDWPLFIVLRCPITKYELGRFTVDAEPNPEFSASKIAVKQ